MGEFITELPGQNFKLNKCKPTGNLLAHRTWHSDGVGADLSRCWMNALTHTGRVSYSGHSFELASFSGLLSLPTTKTGHRYLQTHKAPWTHHDKFIIKWGLSQFPSVLIIFLRMELKKKEKNNKEILIDPAWMATTIRTNKKGEGPGFWVLGHVPHFRLTWLLCIPVLNAPLPLGTFGNVWKHFCFSFWWWWRGTSTYIC